MGSVASARGNANAFGYDEHGYDRPTEKQQQPDVAVGGISSGLLQNGDGIVTSQKYGTQTR